MRRRDALAIGTLLLALACGSDTASSQGSSTTDASTSTAPASTSTSTTDPVRADTSSSSTGGPAVARVIAAVRTHCC